MTNPDHDMIDLTPDWGGIGFGFWPADSPDEDDLTELRFNDPTLGPFRLVLTTDQAAQVAYFLKGSAGDFDPLTPPVVPVVPSQRPPVPTWRADDDG